MAGLLLVEEEERLRPRLRLLVDLGLPNIGTSVVVSVIMVPQRVLPLILASARMNVSLTVLSFHFRPLMFYEDYCQCL